MDNKESEKLDVGYKASLDGFIPTYATEGSVGFDLRSSEDIVVNPGYYTHINTDLVVKVPEGHVMLILPRSSTFRNWGLIMVNSVGVIDSDYCGATDTIKLLFLAMAAAPVRIKRGDRIAQGLIVPVRHATFRLFTPEVKSRGGIGSTGVE